MEQKLRKILEEFGATNITVGESTLMFDTETQQVHIEPSVDSDGEYAAASLFYWVKEKNPTR